MNSMIPVPSCVSGALPSPVSMVSRSVDGRWSAAVQLR